LLYFTFPNLTFWEEHCEDLDENEVERAGRKVKRLIKRKESKRNEVDNGKFSSTGTCISALLDVRERTWSVNVNEVQVLFFSALVGYF